MQAMSRAEVRAYDRWAIEEIGIPALVLMENAGRGAAEVLVAQGPTGRVVICCGKGNNGGDGLVMARHLANRGITVSVLLFAAPDTLSEEAALQWRIVQRLPISAQAWPEPDDGRLRTELAQAEWIVDALFGTGLTGPVRPPFDRVIGCINASRAHVLALDIPSGLNADTGAPMGITIHADHTITFVAPKLGFNKPAAAKCLGQLHVADIGIVRRTPT